MAKFIINNKIYDTETATKLCKYMSGWEVNILGQLMCRSYPTDLYRTQRGNYFCVRKADYSTLVAKLLSEEEAKQILMRNNYERYVEIYGELEEG